MRNLVMITLAVSLSSGAALAAPTKAVAPTAAHKVAAAPAAKISMAQARAIALKLAPGRIIDSEYEKERGAWRYSFDIQQKGHVQEIGIDGRTGKVVENKSEGRVDRDRDHKG